MELALIQELVVKFHDLSYSRHQTQRLQYSLPIAVHELTLLGVLAASWGLEVVYAYFIVCPVIQDSISFICSPVIWLGEMLCVCGGVEGPGLQAQKR